MKHAQRQIYLKKKKLCIKAKGENKKDEKNEKENQNV